MSKKSWWDIIQSWRERLRKSQRETQKLQEKYDRVCIAVYALINYRQRNTLNFQLEKLDDYLRKIENAMENQS